MNKTATTLTLPEYRQLLRLHGTPALADGATGFWVNTMARVPLAIHGPAIEFMEADGGPIEDAATYVVFACAAHDHHHGHRDLARQLPADWVCFAQFYNEEIDLDVFHYGPDQDVPVPV